MRWCALAVALCLGATAAPARAQRCGDRACEIALLDVTPAELARDATRIVALRRAANDARASAGRRVAAARELADLLDDVGRRARAARDLEGLTAEASRAFERIARFPAVSATGDAVAERCVALARRTRAWGRDAEACAVRGLRAQPLRRVLTFPGLPSEWATTEDGDLAAATYARIVARAGDGEPSALLALAAMHGAIGECDRAIELLAPVARRTYEERLLWADVLACAGRTAEAIDALRSLVREASRRFEAPRDLAFVLAPRDEDVPGTRSPAELALALAAAQTYLCTSPNAARRLDDEPLQAIAETAAAALGLDVRARPVLPTRYLGHWYVEQERGRPLATCARARRSLLAGRMPEGMLRTARAPEPCVTPGSGLLVALDRATSDFSVWRLHDGRVVRVRDATECDRAARRASSAAVAPQGVVLEDRMHVVSAGDVNGDAREDLLVASPSGCDCCQDCSDMPDELVVYLGTTEGSFRRASVVRGPDGVQSWIRAVVVGDVDGDRRGDVLVAHGRQVRLHRGTAAGIEEEGTLLHERRAELVMDGIELTALGDADGDRLADAWWIDSDAGEAVLLHGARRSRPRLRRMALPER